MNNEQKLRWLVLSGISETIEEFPVDRLKSNHPATVVIPVSKQVTDEKNTFLNQAITLAHQSESLTDLYRKRAEFDGCPLKKTAQYTLNGRGVLNPDVLCFVDAPDTADEKAGTLLSGEAGMLLDKMLAAIGLNLKENAYVSSLLPWRPPGNRKPTEMELALCQPFWEREIDFLKPKILLLFGSVVAQALLNLSSLPKARGSWHDYHGISARVSISPTTLIKLPEQKKQAWTDLQQVQAKLLDLKSN